jgi:hypothetical protein
MKKNIDAGSIVLHEQIARLLVDKGNDTTDPDRMSARRLLWGKLLNFPRMCVDEQRVRNGGIAKWRCGQEEHDEGSQRLAEPASIHAYSGACE